MMKGGERMEVHVKSLDADIDLKNNGMEIGVWDGDGKFLGDLYVAKSGLTWCKGKTTRAKGIKASWNEFIDWMNT
jgi:hypothetical protein